MAFKERKPQDVFWTVNIVPKIRKLEVDIHKKWIIINNQIKARVTSARWWHSSFLSLLPLMIRTTNNYSCTRRHWENPRTQGEAEAPLCSTETKIGEEKWLHADCIAPLPGKGRTTARDLPWAHGFSSGKREHRVNTQFPEHCGLLLGNPTLVSSHRNYMEIYGLYYWESDCVAEGGKTCNNQHSNFGRPNFYLQWPSISPSRWLCSHAEPNWWYSLIREFGRM